MLTDMTADCSNCFLNNIHPENSHMSFECSMRSGSMDMWIECREDKRIRNSMNFEHRGGVGPDSIGVGVGVSVIAIGTSI